MSKTPVTEFDFDAFNAALQSSTAICAQGRRDIAAAISAGKGLPTKRLVKLGQVWRWEATGQAGVVVQRGSQWHICYLASAPDSCTGMLSRDNIQDLASDDVEWAAETVVDFVKAGGTFDAP